ncbi:MAG: efflux RND transporter permease subunit [Panacagrimonas sp.]
MRGEEWIFASPKVVLGMIFGFSLFFAAQIPGTKIASDFEDLLPQSHPYIQLHNEVRGIFGGANVITVAVKVNDGTIFTNETLAALERITSAIDTLPGVNHNLVSSVTHRTTRNIYVNEVGTIRSDPYFDPNAEPLTTEQLQVLQRKIQSDPRVIGRLVSSDLKVAIVRAQMNTSASSVLLEAFDGLQKIRETESRADLSIYAVGNPVLTGWVYTYLPQIMEILLYTAALIIFLLVVYFRRFYGIALPLLGIVLSSAWGLGFMNLIGVHLDPLSMPIPFLIAARATSHGVQVVERYYYELARTADGKRAARNALDALFRPGSLAIIVDAIGIAAVAIGTAPFNKHLGAFAGFWALSVIFTVHFMCPLALTVLPQPKNIANARDRTSQVFHRYVAPVSNALAGRTILIVAALLIALGAYQSSKVQFGESEPGSPILNANHDYNTSAHLIASSFPGTEEMFVAARTDKKEGLRRPEVMTAMAEFEDFMRQEPAIGAAKGVPDLVKQVSRLTHEGDPRWLQLPDDAREIGGVLYAYEYSSPTPGALREYVNPEESLANLVFYVPDLQVKTINAAMGRAIEGAKKFSENVKGFSIVPSAGIVGVSAAINEANFHDSVLVTAFVLVASFGMVALYYSSLHAGWLMILPMIFATTLSYGYLGTAGIGINVNIIPVIAVGMGVGIDYAIYVMDRVRDEIEKGRGLFDAVGHAVSTTGLAVMFTAGMLVAGVVMWVFLSDLRFQSSAALLLIVMLVLNAIGAMVIVPAWILAFRPKFVVAGTVFEDEVERPHPAPDPAPARSDATRPTSEGLIGSKFGSDTAIVTVER